MLFWILGVWAVLGLIGWAWMNYSAFSHDGPEADTYRAKWWLFLLSPVGGPLMAVANWKQSRETGKFYWGLRFR